ncbi:DUF6301 family protein [Nocardia tengchongensis]|uniref:DUF6301 family protein n=1 Tax=Nocardia tengchongensis TaxID=2055889 RepID=UPI003695BE05
MLSDLDRAVEVVNTALALNWTWSADDFDRFAAAVGWTVTERFEHGATLDTDLSGPSCDANAFISEGTCNYVSFQVIKSDESESVLDGFAELSDLLLVDLGEPTWRRPGATPKIRWDLPTAVVFVCTLETLVYLRIVNPEYQREQDHFDEVVIPWMQANQTDDEL